MALSLSFADPRLHVITRGKSQKYVKPLVMWATVVHVSVIVSSLAFFEQEIQIRIYSLEPPCFSLVFARKMGNSALILLKCIQTCSIQGKKSMFGMTTFNF